MMSKKSLRNQADYVAERFRRLNDDFLIMYGILIWEFIDGKQIDANFESNKLQSMIIRASRMAKSDVAKIFAQQYKDNGYSGKDFPIQPSSAYNNLQNSAGITIVENGKKRFVSAKEAFEKIKTAKDFENLAKQIADSGLRIQNQDLTYTLESFARYSTLQGIKDINLFVQDLLYEEQGANGWEIDYHDNARPSHVYMGGRQFIVGAPRTINGIYFESFEEIAEPRLREPNCLHFKMPIICGVTKPLNTTDQLEQWKKADQAKVKYAGKDFTKYEATQVQRRLEEEIRRCDARITIAQSAGLDIMRRLEQSKRTTLFTEYKKFSSAVGLEMKIKKR